MPLRVVTWNMDNWQGRSRLAEAWEVLAGLDADIALVQEALPPPTSVVHQPALTFPANDSPDLWHISKQRPWGSAIAVFNPGLSIEQVELIPLQQRVGKTGQIAISHPGSFVLAELHPKSGDPISIVSAYGLMEDFNPTINDSYATTSVHRMLSDLMPLLDTRRGKRVVLAGDLNIGDQGALGTKFYRRWQRHHELVLQRFSDLGLTDCLSHMVPAGRGRLEGCRCLHEDCRHVRTHRFMHRVDSAPNQLDYVFAGSDMLSRVTRCEAIDAEEIWSLSDHCPVIAEFDV